MGGESYLFFGFSQVKDIMAVVMSRENGRGWAFFSTMECLECDDYVLGGVNEEY